MGRDRIRIGCGAGFADDRIPPGVEIVERGELDYLAMECLAERTIARETLDRAKDPAKGYTPVLLERMEAIMPPALRRGVRIVTNMGAANPMGAARVVRRHAFDWDCPSYTCAVVTGDEVTDIMRAHPELPLMEDGAPLESLLQRMASANAYLGADVVAQGFATGADLVITGRVADPALFLGPMLHAFGWSYDDWPRIANGTLAGHLLECSGQLTGGCFADPGRKEVEDLAGLGYPLADVWPDGRIEVSKTPGSGGRLDIATCTEQLLYEIHDPTAYITPDCVLDVSAVTFRQIEKDRVALIGARGKPRTATYKVVVGYFDGYMGSGEMGFAGIAIREGHYVMPFGTPGQDTQTQVMLQVMLNLTVFGMELQEAVEAPRFASLSFPSSASPHAYVPGRLLVEPGLHEHVGDALARLGHRAECWPGSGGDYFMNANAACAVLADRTTGVIKGAADPRRPAYAIGW